MPKDSSPEEIAEIRKGQQTALTIGRSMLDMGASGLDTVEVVISVLEDNPLLNAGKGAVYTADNKHELDSSIMDGANLGYSGVTGVTTVKHPIRLSQCVMENSRHVLFAG